MQIIIVNKRPHTPVLGGPKTYTIHAYKHPDRGQHLYDQYKCIPCPGIEPAITSSTAAIQRCDRYANANKIG